MIKQLLPAFRATLALAVLTGILFPLVVTGIAQAAFPHRANGSQIRGTDGKVVGLELIGQPFSKPEYFHPRPSAAGAGYDGTLSSGTNLGPTSSKLIAGIPDDPVTEEVDESYAGVKQLVEQYRKVNGLGPDVKVPVDAVTRSASGLDPHISVANALLQEQRVAKARGLDEAAVKELVEQHTENRDLGILGEPRVHVLKLNRALEGVGR